MRKWSGLGKRHVAVWRWLWQPKKNKNQVGPFFSLWMLVAMGMFQIGCQVTVIKHDCVGMATEIRSKMNDEHIRKEDKKQRWITIVISEITRSATAFSAERWSSSIQLGKSGQIELNLSKARDSIAMMCCVIWCCVRFYEEAFLQLGLSSSSFKSPGCQSWNHDKACFKIAASLSYSDV